MAFSIQFKNVKVSTELKCGKPHIQKPFMLIISGEITKNVKHLNLINFILAKKIIILMRILPKAIFLLIRITTKLKLISKPQSFVESLVYIFHF